MCHFANYFFNSSSHTLCTYLVDVAEFTESTKMTSTCKVISHRKYCIVYWQNK